MVEWVKVPATKPENLSLIPRPRMRKKRAGSCRSSSELHIYALVQSINR